MQTNMWEIQRMITWVPCLRNTTVYYQCGYLLRASPSLCVFLYCSATSTVLFLCPLMVILWQIDLPALTCQSLREAPRHATSTACSACPVQRPEQRLSIKVLAVGLLGHGVEWCGTADTGRAPEASAPWGMYHIQPRDRNWWLDREILDRKN